VESRGSAVRRAEGKRASIAVYVPRPGVASFQAKIQGFTVTVLRFCFASRHGTVPASLCQRCVQYVRREVSGRSPPEVSAHTTHIAATQIF